MTRLQSKRQGDAVPPGLAEEPPASTVSESEPMEYAAVPPPQIQKEVPSDRPVRVYADGIYDLFHFGHARALEQAKKSFPNTYLLVGCCNDEITHRYKGKTVMTESERYESLRHCKFVPFHPSYTDFFFLIQFYIAAIVMSTLRYLKFDTPSQIGQHSCIATCFIFSPSVAFDSLQCCRLRWVDEVIPDAPWVITKEFLDKHQIDYVAHDALPYADASGAGNDVYEFVKSVGKFKETKRTEGISTSDIIMRILKDYNKYVMRNLARGYTRKDLGEKQLRVNMGITKLRETMKAQQEKLHIVAKIAGMHRDEWVENADRWIAGFLAKFEEHCHIMVSNLICLSIFFDKMETAIKDRIQERLRRQSSKEMDADLLQEPLAS
ncbi:hypothetical protein ZIOFF_054072 [Zingiber officinale]|uniref:choline-phosphate cytidylyltransferase n=1 Tax=Zingiber officinale TaxID=94328 RepID=A0A8J5FGZ9_ZINOF|nr:hypothetical protein ZIOFF_054072 [Zingiber officinale]